MLILASTSPYRRVLLGRLEVEFNCLPPGIDETPEVGETPHALVVRLAGAKAAAIAAQAPDAVIIGSDQIAVLRNDAGQHTVLGKPGTPERCGAQLAACSGREVAFLTAVAVMRRRDSALCEFVDTTRVLFRALDAATIERYVARESPLDCAGSFKSEGLGITLCAAIDSADPTALIGLPLLRLSAALRNFGFLLP